MILSSFNLLVFYCIIIVHNLYSPARHLFLAMPPLMSLPPDVLQTLPWEESDLSSVVLTCRLFHQLFTPRLYDNFTAEADYLDLRYPGLDFPEFLFLRTIRNCPTLASFVQDLSLTLVGLSYWDHEDFRRVARDLEIAADFHTVALPAGPSAQTPTEDMVLGKQESAIHQEGVGEPLSERHGSDRDAEGNMYSEEQFLEDFGCALLSKLPQLRRLTLMYDRMRLFDRFAHFAYLEEVNIDSARIPVRAAGNELFEDAVRLLGLPKIRKWSLSCAEVSESAIRCIPPQSSPVQEISISCPNIPARDFHYLMAIPKALKVFRWNLKAWTCYLMSEGTLPVHEQWMEAGREVDDSDPDSGNHHEDIVDSAESEGHTECQTLSPASMFSSLRHLQTSLEEISVEYAFIGSCSHADPGPSSLDDFTNLKKLSISPQILRGFHGCTDQETCATECTHLHPPRRAVDHLPPTVTWSDSTSGCRWTQMRLPI